AAATNSSVRHTGRIVLSEKMVWGGILDLYGHVRELTPADAGKEWIWTFEGLVSRSILPDPAAAPVPDPHPMEGPPA
ncbi:MAG TPA: hypothetical protein VK465_12975, partial [Fibrobacteria bacterium]|nr:hypothetical protein [Fibrobacteria bacterium]